MIKLVQVRAKEQGKQMMKMKMIYQLCLTTLKVAELS